ncbi:hypothetical protein EMCLV028L [Equine molluscum contagiosum-like virus]|nr:hypothetical protein EMCLV028L [Equine molluscum contagiosum-like virus]
MNVTRLDQVIGLRPFHDMSRVKINRKENCILANRCFVKLAEVFHMPKCSVPTSASMRVNNHSFTLHELLYSPFHYKQLQYQYLLPGFVFTCIEIASRNRRTCYYCKADRLHEEDSLNLNIFVPTTTKSFYVVIGVRIKHYWSELFELV